MKAVVLHDFGGPEQLTWKDLPQPVPGSGQVLVRVAATSLNPVDLKRASGTMRQIFPVEFPFIPGGDFSGVVEGLGEGVATFQLGDEVFGYSAQCNAPKGGTAKVNSKPIGRFRCCRSGRVRPNRRPPPPLLDSHLSKQAGFG